MCKRSFWQKAGLSFYNKLDFLMRSNEVGGRLGVSITAIIFEHTRVKSAGSQAMRKKSQCQEHMT